MQGEKSKASLVFMPLLVQATALIGPAEWPQAAVQPELQFPGLWNGLTRRCEGTCGEKCSANGPALLVQPSGLPPPLPLAQQLDELSTLVSSPTPLPTLLGPLGQAAVSQPHPGCFHHNWQVPLT